MKKITWITFAFLCVAVSCYPFMYLQLSDEVGLLSTKTDDLRADLVWRTAFYTHISLGGLALLVGWTQFSSQWRAKYLRIHRLVGKIYLLSVLGSGLAGCYIAFFATGGLIAQAGFFCLDVIWLTTSALAYVAILRSDTRRHEKAMIFSYAACFAAVTLRLELPLLIMIMQGEFIPAYRTVAWLCWVPNMVVASILVNRK